MERVNTDRIAAVILAAGYPGNGGKLAPLQKLGNANVLERTTESLILAGLRDITLVTGSWRNEIIDDYLYSNDVKEAYNRGFDDGVLSNVRAGVSNLTIGPDAFLLLPGDSAAIYPETVKQVIKYYYDEEPDADVIYVEYEGKRGYPILLSAKMITPILNNDHPDGLRGIVEVDAKKKRVLPVGDPGILYNMNTDDGYYRLREYSHDYDISRKNNAEILLAQSDAPAHVKAHCRFVGRITEIIAEELYNAGVRIDDNAAIAAAYLHDVKRLDYGHENAARLFAWDNGMARAGAVIGSHMGKGISDKRVGPKEVMFLADKYALEDILVSLDRRFDRAEHRRRNDGEALMTIKRIRTLAKAIKQNIEQAIGHPLDPVLTRQLRDEGMVL